MRLKQNARRLQQISVYPGVHFVPGAVEQKMLQMNTHTRTHKCNESKPAFAYEMCKCALNNIRQRGQDIVI